MQIHMQKYMETEMQLKIESGMKSETEDDTKAYIGVNIEAKTKVGHINLKNLG